MARSYHSGYSSDTRPDTSYTRMLSRIGAMKIPYRTVKTGDTITFDPVVPVHVLNPQTVFSKTDYENSVVLKIIYGNTSFLYMGHFNGISENIIAESSGHADILNVGSFGDSGSSGPAFLSHVKPGISIIAALDMPQYNIPAVETIHNLKESGSKVFITYLNGTGKVASDGKTYSVSFEK